VVCKKYEEPESCGSAADFLLGVEMEGDPPGRMEVEGDVLMAVETDLFFNANDSNKCQCPSPIVESTTAVDDANVGTDYVVVDILAVDGSSDDRDVEGVDRNNNNQPLERAEGEAVAIKKIMGGVAGISMTMPWMSSLLIRRGRMGGGGEGR